MKNYLLATLICVLSLSPCFAHSNDFRNPSIMKLAKQITYPAQLLIESVDGEFYRYEGKFLTEARLGFVEVHKVRRQRIDIGRVCFYKTIDLAKFEFFPVSEEAPQMALMPYTPEWVSDDAPEFLEEWFAGSFKEMDRAALKAEGWEYFLFDCNQARGDGVGETKQLQAKVEAALVDNTYEQLKQVLILQLKASGIFKDGFSVQVTPIDQFNRQLH